MFEKYTQRARQVVALSQEEARELRHGYLGTEHLLIALLREGEGIAARVLLGHELTAESIRGEVIRIVGRGEDPVIGHIPFTPRAKKVLELSLREALSLGHDWIGTEHLLLGLVRENEGVACRILLDRGLDSERVRNEVIRMLSGPGTPRRQPKATYTLATADALRAENETLRAAARVLVDELGDAWWVKAGRAYEALEKIVGPTTNEERDP
jgi:ATP-dependent Clp protease ATP-binding subunit ClpC